MGSDWLSYDAATARGSLRRVVAVTAEWSVCGGYSRGTADVRDTTEIFDLLLKILEQIVLYFVETGSMLSGRTWLETW